MAKRTLLAAILILATFPAAAAERLVGRAKAVDGQTLVCDLTGERTRGRRVGVCRLDEADVGAEVIAAGLARDCPRFSKGRYVAVESRVPAQEPYPERPAGGRRRR